MIWTSCWVMIGCIGLSLAAPAAAQGQNDHCPYRVHVSDPLDKMHSLVGGYRYVRATITRIGPDAIARSGQTYQISHRLQDSLENSRIESKVMLHIPAGQSVGTVELPIGRKADWQFGQLEFLDVQANRDGYSTGNMDASIHISTRNQGMRMQIEAPPTFLFVSNKAICDYSDYGQVCQPGDKKTLASVIESRAADLIQLPNVIDLYRVLDGESRRSGETLIHALIESKNPSADADRALLLNNSDMMMALLPGELPTQWIGLMPVNFLIISLSDLRAMSATHPEQWLAVRDWIRAGGRLVVTDCQSASNHFNEFEELSGLAHLGSRLRPIWYAWDDVDWQHAAACLQQSTDSQSDTYVYLFSSLFGGSSDSAPLAATSYVRSLDRVADVSPAVAYMDWGAGRVIVMSPDSCDFTGEHWVQVLASGWVNSLARSPRRVIGEMAGKFRPTGLRVPGVGQPPYLVFAALISGFALAVGPGLYILLARWRRLGLMVVIVPFFSLLVSLGLVLYAIVIDGFEFRVARQSGSILDGRTGVITTFTDIAVFSGLNPGMYSFSPHTTPFEPSPVGSTTVKSFLPGETLVRGDWTRARTHHQMNTLTITETSRRLAVFQEVADDGAATDWWLHNELGCVADLILVSTAEGLYFAADIPPGRTKLQRVPDDSALRTMCRPYVWSTVNIRPFNFYECRNFYWWGQSDPAFAWQYQDFTGLCQRWQYPLEESLGTSTNWLRAGEFLVLLNAFDGATQLRENEKAIQERHFIRGRW